MSQVVETLSYGPMGNVDPSILKIQLLNPIIIWLCGFVMKRHKIPIATGLVRMYYQDQFIPFVTTLGAWQNPIHDKHHPQFSYIWQAIYVNMKDIALADSSKHASLW